MIGGQVSDDKCAHWKDAGPGRGSLLLDLVDMVEVSLLRTWDAIHQLKLNLQAKGKQFRNQEISNSFCPLL